MRRVFLTFGLLMCLACQPAVSVEVQPNADLKMTPELFIRIIKTTQTDRMGVLEAWRRGADGQFHLDRTFPICTWSGELGPKLREGDGQSPEGFYFVRPTSLNPNSSYHLSFNLGYPNAFDRAHNRTGSFLMVHGECVSIG